MRGAIDLHTHILPGLDDGTSSLAEAFDLARAAAREGTVSIAATPHVRDDFPTAPEDMELGVSRLGAALAAAGIPIRVLHGGEVALERATRMDASDLARFTLGQTGRYLLIEFPYSGWPFVLEGVITRITAFGITPLLAHPERNSEVQNDPTRLEGVCAEGALVQVTAASVDGRAGSRARATARRLVDLRLMNVIASDAHGPTIREAGLDGAVRELGDDRLSHYATVEAPHAIAAGETIGRPPPLTRRRRFFLR